jgi:hypothetical protein
MASDGKIDALKTATKALLDQLKTAAAKDGDVYVSIVPFSKDINIGKSNYAANYIDWTDWDGNNGSCSKHDTDVKNKTDCLAQNGNPKWTPNDHSSWNGCVTDRGNSTTPNSDNYDTNVTAPSTANVATLFPAEQFGSCSPQAKPLSYDWNGMKTLVDGFYPAGNTNQGIGLAHAWLSLVGGGPYPTPPTEEPGYKYSKIIILMTDGMNTQNRWYTGQNQIDGRQKMTCDNVNTAGVTLYTIQVNTSGDPTSALLQSCAGSPGLYPDTNKFFLLTSANQMVSTFKQIGTQISSLRISQ